MPDSVFTYRMSAGIPGEITRFQTLGTTIKPEVQNAANPVTAYGQACIVDSNGARPVAAGDTAMPALGFGISVRPFPGTDNTVANPGTVPFGAGTPPTKGVVDIARRAYINVKVNVGAAVKGGAVYVYYGVNSGNHVQAGFEAAAGANLWQLTNAEFTGPADANGNVEIAFNI